MLFIGQTKLQSYWISVFYVFNIILQLFNNLSLIREQVSLLYFKTISRNLYTMAVAFTIYIENVFKAILMILAFTKRRGANVFTTLKCLKALSRNINSPNFKSHLIPLYCIPVLSFEYVPFSLHYFCHLQV